MSVPLFKKHIIAVVWDFDKTLTPDYMQSPLFRHYGLNAKEFWDEVNAVEEFYRFRGLDLVTRDTLYLNHILTYVRHDKLPGLTNEKLRELGQEIEFYPGMPGFLGEIKRVAELPDYQNQDIQIEHYIVSTGLRAMIQGSRIAPEVEYVWACEFVSETPEPGFLKGQAKYEIALEDISKEDATSEADRKPIADIGYAIDNTTKTRAIFEINKGVTKERGISVNDYINHEDRRVPFENMIYIADGPSDVPVFSLIKSNGGKTFAVYNPESKDEFKQVNQLHAQGRITNHGPADYREGSHTHKLIMCAVQDISDRIVKARKLAIAQRVGKEPKHLSGSPAPSKPEILPPS